MGARQRFDDEPAGCAAEASPAPELRADDCGGGGGGGGDAWTWRSARTRFFVLFIATLRVGVDGMLMMMLSYVFRDEPFACSAGLGTGNALASPSASCAACAGATPAFSAYSVSVSAAAMYGLVCSRLWVVAAIKSAFFLGMGLGGSVGGCAAERFGRRRSCSSFTPILSWPAAAIFALGSGPVSLSVGYAVSGFSIGFHLEPLYLTVVEVFHDVPSWRARCGSMMWIGWCVMVASVAGIALAIDARAERIAAAAGPAMPAWRVLLLTVFALQLPAVAVLARYLPESPAWLRANGMHAELHEVMALLRGERGDEQRRPAPPRNGACANGGEKASLSSQGDLQRMLAPIDEAGEPTDASDCYDDGAAPSLPNAVRQRPGTDGDGGGGDGDGDAPPARGAEGRPASLLSMRDRHLGRPMLVLTLNTLVSWFSVSLVYYGLFLNSASFSNSLYVGTTISTLEQVLPYWYAARVMDAMGRRRTQVLCFGVGAVACALCGVLTGPVMNALGFLALLVISMSFGVVYTFTSELFPTSLRGRALGLGLFASRAGSVLAPQVQVLFGAISPAVPAAVFGVSSLLAVGANLMLPETGDLS